MHNSNNRDSDNRLIRLEAHILDLKESISFIKGKLEQKDNSNIALTTIISTIIASLISFFKH